MRARTTAAALAGALLCAALATGCAGHGGGTAAPAPQTANSPSPAATRATPDSSQLGRMTRLLDTAASAASAADSDTAKDG